MILSRDIQSNYEQQLHYTENARAERINRMHPNRWTKKISNFDPRAHLQDDQACMSKRSRGRPRQRWEDHLNMFSMYYGFANWHAFMNYHEHDWHTLKNDSASYVLNDWPFE